MSFIEEIKNRARLNKKTIVLPEASDIRTIEAAAMAIEENIANIILLGNKDEIYNLANGNNLNISDAIVIDPTNSDTFNIRYIKTSTTNFKNST